MWAPGDLDFEVLDDGTDDPIVTVRIGTPDGVLLIMAEVAQEGRTLRLLDLHIQSDAGANAIGLSALRLIANVAMERMDYDEIVVEGAVRTTGANPGHRPRPLRFARRARAAPGEEAG